MFGFDGQYDWVFCSLAVVVFAIVLHAVMSTNDERIRRLQESRQRAEVEFLPQIRGE